MKIHEKLRNIRENLHLSRKNVADNIFVSKELINEIENGRTRLSLEMFLNLCSLYNVSPMELIKLSEEEHYILLNNEDIKKLEITNELLFKITQQIHSSKQDATIITGDIKGNNITIAKDYNKKINTGHIDGDNIKIGINTSKK